MVSARTVWVWSRGKMYVTWMYCDKTPYSNLDSGNFWGQKFRLNLKNEHQNTTQRPYSFSASALRAGTWTKRLVTRSRFRFPANHALDVFHAWKTEARFELAAQNVSALTTGRPAALMVNNKGPLVNGETPRKLQPNWLTANLYTSLIFKTRENVMQFVMVYVSVAQLRIRERGRNLQAASSGRQEQFTAC